MRPAVSAVKIACQVCYGVIFVGTAANGKFYCRTCKVWTRAKV